MIIDGHYSHANKQDSEEPRMSRNSKGKSSAPLRLNPPPGWPPVPPGWVPPPGWQPDPSWPDPPSGWNLWTEDTAARNWQVRAAGWVIAGGAAVFLGSLLPFLASPRPDYYTLSAAPKDMAEFFGIVLAILGGVMRARSRRVHVISGISAFIVAGLTELALLGLIAAGIHGFNQTDVLFGTSHVTWSPQIGIFISAIGCAVAGIGGIISFRPAEQQVPNRGPLGAR
jgi:hypothetical protein